jgi:signal transduction histidine kinase
MSQKQVPQRLQVRWFQRPNWFQQAMEHATRQPSYVVTATAMLTLLSFTPSAWSMWQAYRNFSQIIRHEFRLRTLSDQITYLDEVLTMSALMNATTGDPQWQQRYFQYEPKLEAVIQESIQLAPQAYQASTVTTDRANQALVDMEERSFVLVRQGKRTAALALLSGQDYRMQKQIYAEGVAVRNQMITAQLQSKIAHYRHQLFWAGLILGFCLLALSAAWLLVLRILQTYLRTQNSAQMALETANQQLEQQVQERTQMLNQKTLDLQQALQTLQSQQMQLVQSEKMSSLGQLVGGMAHEINNPISFVHGNLYHIEEYTEDLLELIALYQQNYPEPISSIQDKIASVDLEFLQADLSKILQSMQVGTDRVRQIVLRLRNFSRMDESGLKQVNVHDGLNDTLMLLHHRLKATVARPEIPVVQNYGDCPKIACYPGPLNQVFMNILVNAIEAIEAWEEIFLSHEPDLILNPARGITISTELISELADPEQAAELLPNQPTDGRASLTQWLQIVIADRGVGIDASVLPRIFDPFFTTKSAGKGTGLGMSISYQIITQMHRGTISCSSVPGEGSEFVIRLPLQCEAEKSPQADISLQTAGA